MFMISNYESTFSYFSDHNGLPIFLNVKLGDFVIVNQNRLCSRRRAHDWWMGQVVSYKGGPGVDRIFEVVDVDDECVYWVSADRVRHVVHALDGLI